VSLKKAEKSWIESRRSRACTDAIAKRRC
jgi:hypothetical protein